MRGNTGNYTFIKTTHTHKHTHTPHTHIRIYQCYLTIDDNALDFTGNPGRILFTKRCGFSVRIHAWIRGGRCDGFAAS